MPISDEAPELINMVEDNTLGLRFISVVNIKLSTQDTSFCMLHSVFPHPIGHTAPKDLHSGILKQETEDKKTKTKPTEAREIVIKVDRVGCNTYTS